MFLGASPGLSSSCNFDQVYCCLLLYAVFNLLLRVLVCIEPMWCAGFQTGSILSSESDSERKS